MERLLLKPPFSCMGELFDTFCQYFFCFAGLGSFRYYRERKQQARHTCDVVLLDVKVHGWHIMSSVVALRSNIPSIILASLILFSVRITYHAHAEQIKCSLG